MSYPVVRFHDPDRGGRTTSDHWQLDSGYARDVQAIPLSRLDRRDRIKADGMMIPTETGQASMMTVGSRRRPDLSQQNPT